MSNTNAAVALYRAFSDRLLWVTSSLSASYQPNGWFRVHTGHSEVDFAGAAN